MPSPLTILFQDEWIIAVDKPAGQLVHPADVPEASDLVTMKILRDQVQQHVHAIHRLDRPTSGVLLFATNSKTARLLRKSFDNHQVQKTYWAIVSDFPLGTRERWTCHEPIQKTEDAPARPAETHFQLLKHLQKNLALIEAAPKTGRFHQIRRHLLHAGHPIVGDYRYVGIEQCDALGEELGIGTRMLLQAKSLSFLHPLTGEHLSVEAPVDPMIEKVILNQREE